MRGCHQPSAATMSLYIAAYFAGPQSYSSRGLLVWFLQFIISHSACQTPGDSSQRDSPHHASGHEGMRSGGEFPAEALSFPVMRLLLRYHPRWWYCYQNWPQEAPSVFLPEAVRLGLQTRPSTTVGLVQEGPGDGLGRHQDFSPALLGRGR